MQFDFPTPKGRKITLSDEDDKKIKKNIEREEQEKEDKRVEEKSLSFQFSYYLL